MKKILLGIFLTLNVLSAEVLTILQYGANLNFARDTGDSVKKDGNINGVYVGIGNLSYLLDVDYSTTQLRYSQPNTTKLDQIETTITYSKYFTNFMIKGGLHNIDTTDTNLGNGNVYILTMGGYHWSEYDKHNYGLESYYSSYEEGINYHNNTDGVNLLQFSPYYLFSKSLGINTRNNIGFKLNYISTSSYETQSYISYSIEYILYHKDFLMELKAFSGEMKTGVKNGGNTAYNSKDILQDGYGIKLGYTIKTNLLLSAGYGFSNFEEHSTQLNAKNEVSVLMLSATF